MSWYSGLFNNINLTLGGKSPTSRKLAEIKNAKEFMDTFSNNILKALARYDIEELPETCDQRVIKESLLFHGSVAYFEKENSLLALPCAPDGDLTLNGDIRRGFIYGRNGYNGEINLYIRGADEAPILKKTFSDVNGKPSGVFVRENDIAYPFLNYSLSYAMRVSDAMRALDVVRENMKQPYIVVAEESILPTVKKFFEDKQANVEKIVSSGVFPADKLSIVPIPVVPETVKSYTDLIEWYENKYDRLCGYYNNANPDKKERLLVDEVNANNDSTDALIDHIVEYLQEEHDYVNKIFGTNIKIVKRKGDNGDDIQSVDNNAGSSEMGS